MPELIRAGASRPDRCRQETYWARDDLDRNRIIRKNGQRRKAESTRFEGLGEMMPKVLWETTPIPRPAGSSG